jgi:ADP-ribosylglycohydrolase
MNSLVKAVNPGENMDITGAVTGGLALLYYGFESFPHFWVATLARKDDIQNLEERPAKRMRKKY